VLHPCNDAFSYALFFFAATRYHRLLSLGEGRALILYRGAGNYARARVVAAEGSAVLLGDEVVLVGATVADIAACALDGGRVVVALEYSGKVEVKVLTLLKRLNDF